MHENGARNYKIAQEKGIHEASVRTIIKMKETLKAQAKSSSIKNASKLRIGIETQKYGKDCVLFFGETESSFSKGINYFFDRYGGNKKSGPGLRSGA